MAQNHFTSKFAYKIFYQCYKKSYDLITKKEKVQKNEYTENRNKRTIRR